MKETDALRFFHSLLKYKRMVFKTGYWAEMSFNSILSVSKTFIVACIMVVHHHIGHFDAIR